MKLSEFIELLQEISDSLPDSDPEVHVHYQPSYPLRGTIANVRTLEDDVVIAVSSTMPRDENPYGSREAWEGM